MTGQKYIKSGARRLWGELIRALDEEYAALLQNPYSVEPSILNTRAIHHRERAESIGYQEGIADSYVLEGMSKVSFVDREALFRQALEQAEEISYRRGIAFAKWGIAWTFYLSHSHSYAETLELAWDAYLIGQTTNDLTLTWYAARLLTPVFAKLGDSARAYDMFKKAYAIAVARGTPGEIVSTITMFPIMDGMMEISEEYLLKAVEHLDDESVSDYQRAIVLGNLAVTLTHHERLEESKLYIERVEEIIPRLAEEDRAQFYCGIGTTLFYHGRVDEAKEKIELGLLHQEDYPLSEVRCGYCILGQIITRSDPSEAIPYFQRAIGIASENPDVDWEDPNCPNGHLAELYRGLGDDAKASEQFALYKEITETKKLVADKQRSELFRILQKLDHALEQEQKLLEEVESKSRDLASKAMLLAEQTELMANFRDDLRAILRKVEANDPAINEIRRKLRELPEAVNWKEFDAQFQSVHPQFRKHLEEKYPDLTKTELKLCVLLRLNLKSVDIGKLLSLSTRTIENHRHNIRKKLHLEPARDIAKFLTNI